jgi:4-amino-4-deoxy-L-arabinose transferase-like glycosyltransferase
MTDISLLKKYRDEVLLSGILILSAFLNLWNIWNQGFSNAYYAAAVRSMLANPALLFFNSFDAAGFITVDKPPVGLWVQAASATLFGFSGGALVLPQALAGVGSVALVYLIVSRAFGKPAGLVSAFALAVTPIFVAVSRNGTMDGLLIFVLLLAVWVALKAAREGSLPCLLLSVFLIGLGFNIKMIQAFIAVPAVIAIYLLGAREIPMKKRVAHIILAIAVLAVVSLLWAVAVDQIPADQRPYIGGSGDNTVLGLIVNYNGIHRLENGMTGQVGGPGLFPGATTMGGDMVPGDQGVASFAPGGPQNRTAERSTDRSSTDRALPPGMGPGSAVAGEPPGGLTGGSTGSSGIPAGTGPGNGMGGGMGDEAGSPGITRLFSEGLAGQISWLLPFALIGLLALWKRPESLSLTGLEDAGLFSEKGLTLLAMGLWLLPGLLYFSFTTGFWHTYYLATIAPPLAALAGIGAVAMYEAYMKGGVQGWVLVGAVLITGLVQVIILLYTAAWSGPLTAVIGIGTVALGILLGYLILKKRTGTGTLPNIVAAGAIALLFVAPFVWSCTPLMYGSGNILPVAGPRLSGQMSGGDGMNAMPGSLSGGNVSNLAAYLLSHSTGETYLVAVPSSMNAGADLIIGTGKPVMALGGFAGSDQVLTVDELKHLVNEGKIRYFYLSGDSSPGGGGMNTGNSAIFSWVQGNCTVIPSSSWGGNSSSTMAESRLLQSFAGTGNRTLPGMQNDMIGPSGTSGFAAGNQNSLYDCAAYEG